MFACVKYFIQLFFFHQSFCLFLLHVHKSILYGAVYAVWRCVRIFSLSVCFSNWMKYTNTYTKSNDTNSDTFHGQWVFFSLVWFYFYIKKNFIHDLWFVKCYANIEFGYACACALMCLNTKYTKCSGLLHFFLALAFEFEFILLNFLVLWDTHKMNLTTGNFKGHFDE